MLSRQVYKSIARRCRGRITPLTISKRSQSITTSKINERRRLFDTAKLGARYIDDGRRSISCFRSFNIVNCNSGSSSSMAYDCSHDVQQLNRHMICNTSLQSPFQQKHYINRQQYSSIPQLKHQHNYQQYCFSTLPDSDSDESDSESSIKSNPQINRLSKIRNVGIFAHVDAGKTTVTERMLALSGLIHNTGSVDTGDTVTDYLPAERERGITIQSAAVCFDWIVPPSSSPTTTSTSNNSSSIREPQQVSINLIDTPGHVDFSVEVHRSVAVLDGAVLVVDAVAGVQAQTETVWRAIRNTDSSSSSSSSSTEAEEDNTGKDDYKTDTKRKNKSALHGSHAHEPLPTIMYINKMDREGSDFNYAIDTVKRKLNGSNPLVVQLPLYRVGSPGSSGVNGERGSTDGRVGRESLGEDIVAGTLNDTQPPPHGTFIGMIDLVNLRAIIYPSNIESSSMEEATPSVISLTTNNAKESNPTLVENAMDAHCDLISNLANVDEVMEDLYLEATMEDEDNFHNYISISDIQSSLKRMTLQRKVMPTLCGAALRGLGVEPVLDCVAEYLPCPLDRLPPRLSMLGSNSQHQKQKKQQQQSKQQKEKDYSLGHPLNTSTLAYVFKVLHMKGRGGSGDGRVAFARVYSGILKARDSVRVISPSNINSSSAEDGKNKKQKHPIERIGGMLELAGGTFGNLPEGSCRSGDVCALVGLKSVVTGDTLLLTSAGSDASDNKKKSTKKNKKGNDIHVKQYMDGVHLAGLTSPRPVLTLRVEANSASEQSRLSAALALLVVEDPSLVVEETATTTLISGLGELHMEIVLDRLRREFGVEVRTGKPAVAYREMVLLEDGEVAETDGLLEYDRTVGGVRLQGAVHLQLRQSHHHDLCIPPEDPTVSMSSKTREYFNLDPNPSSSDDESEHKYSPALRALLSGVRGSLKRGRLGPYPLANMECHIVDVDTELSSQDTLPGSMRAAAANAVTTLLETMANEDRMLILEPKMNVEISVPTGRVGDVLSDLTGRRGTVDDVAMADEGGSSGGGDHVKSMVRAEVPLLEILGYANSLRSLTGGEGAFSAEYKGHAPQEGM